MRVESPEQLWPNEAFIPMKAEGLRRLCMKWLFPGLLIALVIGPHPWARSLYIGQIIVLLNDLSAMIIVFAANRGRIWPILLIC